MSFPRINWTSGDHMVLLSKICEHIHRIGWLMSYRKQLEILSCDEWVSLNLFSVVFDNILKLKTWLTTSLKIWRYICVISSTILVILRNRLRPSDAKLNTVQCRYTAVHILPNTYNGHHMKDVWARKCMKLHSHQLVDTLNGRLMPCTIYCYTWVHYFVDEVVDLLLHKRSGYFRIGRL